MHIPHNHLNVSIITKLPYNYSVKYQNNNNHFSCPFHFTLLFNNSEGNVYLQEMWKRHDGEFYTELVMKIVYFHRYYNYQCHYLSCCMRVCVCVCRSLCVVFLKLCEIVAVCSRIEFVMCQANKYN